MGRYIYILNFGDYFSRLTAREIKKLGGKPKIISFNTPFADLRNPAGFILSGSPHGSIRIPVNILNKDLFTTNLPILGICVGGHLMLRYFGGKYKNLKKCSEHGMIDLYMDKRGKLFEGLKKNEKVFMMHEDSIVDPGKGFVPSAHTESCPIAAAWHKKWRWYALQFHPELSDCGDRVFENFLKLCYEDIAQASPKGHELESFGFEEKKVIKPSLP